MKLLLSYGGALYVIKPKYEHGCILNIYTLIICFVKFIWVWKKVLSIPRDFDVTSMMEVVNFKKGQDDMRELWVWEVFLFILIGWKCIW